MVAVSKLIGHLAPQQNHTIKMEGRALSSCFLLLFLFFATAMIAVEGKGRGRTAGSHRLRFDGKKGEFKILQIADMHYANGRSTECLDVFPNQLPTCSDLNTTAFIYRVIKAEKPDLVVFSGDNIFGMDCTDPAKSMDLAFSPVVRLRLPWAAILGNHDQEGTLTREGVMRYIVGMPHTLSRLNPAGADDIEGFGNYHLEVGGTEASPLANKSVLNLYFVDSGDYSTGGHSYYDWVKPAQQHWFKRTSTQLQNEYKSEPAPQKDPAPGLVYFHIPLVEYSSFNSSDNSTEFTGVKQEDISSADVSSGFLGTMMDAGDVRAAFVGHDHLNDFCAMLDGIQHCYAGGFGYHAYGKAGWARRARVVSASLETAADGSWGGVESIKTWKRLDDEHLSTIDNEVLWNKFLQITP